FPLAILAILITIFIVPKGTTVRSLEKGFDWPGFAVLTVCLCTLVFALMQGGDFGWTSLTILGCFLIAIIMAILFVWIERRHLTPFIDLKLFRNDCFSRCVWIVTLIQFAYTSIIFWSLYLQYVLLLPPQKVGVLLLAAQIPMFFMAPVGG